MANTVGKFGKASRSSILGAMVDDVLRIDGQGKPVLSPEIDFIESAQGLGLTLYPVQRVITKACFGIPMDYKEGKVPVWNPMHTQLLYTFTDREYLKWVHEQGRCNFGDWRDLPQHGFHTMDLFMGRRAGKSVLVSGIVGAKLRNLLSHPDPQKLYSLAAGDQIDLTAVGTDLDSSSRLYSKIRAAVLNSPFFEPFLKVNNNENLLFVTEKDRERADATPSIQVASVPCTTRSVRGPSSIALLLDEFAHFRSDKSSNSEDFYIAASPAVSGFTNPETGLLDSITVMISSPWTRSGKMYELYAEAMEQGSSAGTFAFRCCTAEMNYRISAQAVMKMKDELKEKFRPEVEAEFIDGTGSYIPSIKFDPCIDLDRKNRIRFDINAYGRKYFWWVDLGMKNDATGLAIGHLEMVEGSGIELIFDYIDRMMVGEEFLGPGVKDPERIKDLVELQTVDILAWMQYMNDIYPCHAGGTDQHGGTMLKQSLHIQGMNTFEYYHSTADLNSKMAFALKGFIDRKAARFPNEEKFLSEFRKLEATWVNKYTIKVEAPNEKGCHDDMSDAAQGVAWLAEKWLDEEGKLDQDPSGKSLQSDQLITNPAPITNVDAVSMRDLTVMARMEKTRGLAMLPAQYAGMQLGPRPFARTRMRK